MYCIAQEIIPNSSSEKWTDTIVTQTVNTFSADISLKLSDCEKGCHIWVNTVNVLLQMLNTWQLPSVYAL